MERIIQEDRKKEGWSLGSGKDRPGRLGEGGRREYRAWELERIIQQDWKKEGESLES